MLLVQHLLAELRTTIQNLRSLNSWNATVLRDSGHEKIRTNQILAARQNIKSHFELRVDPAGSVTFPQRAACVAHTSPHGSVHTCAQGVHHFHAPLAGPRKLCCCEKISLLCSWSTESHL